MILIGDKLVPFEKIEKISKIEDIIKTSSNCTLLFDFKEEILTYCSQNNLFYAVLVSNIKEAIYANSLSAKYIICPKDLACKLQKIADNYMFDSRILSIIKSNDELEDIALNEIDGVIYSNLL